VKRKQQLNSEQYHATALYLEGCDHTLEEAAGRPSGRADTSVVWNLLLIGGAYSTLNTAAEDEPATRHNEHLTAHTHTHVPWLHAESESDTRLCSTGNSQDNVPRSIRRILNSTLEMGNDYLPYNETNRPLY